MNELEWEIFLKKFSQVLVKLDLKRDEKNFSKRTYELGYFEFKGTTEEEIRVAEERLGIKFPPTFRSFLRTSSGWPDLGAASPGILWPANQINWLRDQDLNLLKTWTDDCPAISLAEHLYYRDIKEDTCRFNPNYLANTLAISDYGDACVLLLSPDVLDEHGEWECWKLASWYPGAARYHSFAEWIKSSYEFYLDSLSDEDEDK